MTPKQKIQFIDQRIQYWRNLLDLPHGLRLTIKYITPREDDDEQRYGRAFIHNMPYKRATIEIYEKVFAAPNFKEEAEKVIVHELMHLALNPLISFVSNIFSEASGNQKHLEDLEENFITTLEEALHELTKKSI